MTILWDSSRGDVHNLDAIPIGAVTPSTGVFTSLKSTTAATGAASVTASTTHTIAGATPLSMMSLVDAANADDAVKLPPTSGAVGQTWVVISVGSTATIAIYPGNSSDTIDGGSAGASTTLTAAHRGATFYCPVAGNWVSSLFGAVSS